MAILKAPGTTAGRNDLLRSERIAGGILPKVLNSFDMVVIVVAIILWIPNSVVMTGAGAAAFIYWGLGFITFLIPGAIVTGQLGLMFPGEGSIYVWTTKAFGRFTGFIAGFCAWWPGIISLIAAGDVVVSLIQHLGALFKMTPPLLQEPSIQGFVIIITIVLSYVLSILRFRLTQNLVNMIFLAYGCAILLIGLAGVLWLVTGHAARTDLSFQSGHWGLNGSNFTFYSTVILALLGIEVPLIMGVEIRDMRSIRRYLIWGSIIVMIAYLITTFAVMVAVPPRNQGSLAGIAEAVQMGFGPAGTVVSAIVDVLLIGYFVFAGAVYNYSYARLLFVSGLDRRLPAIISKVNSKRVPWVAVLTQTILGISFTAIIFILAPSFKSAPLSTAMYDILFASETVVWCVSMVMLFIDVIIIRRRYRDLFQRSRIAPDQVFYLCSIIGTIASLFGIAVIFTNPWTNSAELKPLTTGQWDIWIAGITAASLFVAVVGFYIGQHTVKSDLRDEEIIKVVTN